MTGPDAGDARGGDASFFFAATGGGVQRVNVLLANAFLERGISVHCVLPQARGPHLARLDPRGHVVDLGTRAPFPLVRRLARHLDSARPSAIVASQQHAIVAALWARRLARHRPRIVVVQHNTLSVLCRQSPRFVVRQLLPPLARLTFGMADAIGAVSEGVADDLATVVDVPRSRIHVLRNPVVTPDVLDLAQERTGHPWLDHKDRPVVLGSGNLIANKDFPTLIHAFARLRRTRPARLVILGEGTDRSKLIALAGSEGVADDTDLPGFSPNPFAFMARADVFALSSTVEGFGLVIAEALACGCPVVATDCPSGPREILEDGRYGRLVPMRNPAALAAAIEATLESPPDRRWLRAHGLTFSVEPAVGPYVDLCFGELANARHG
jgi:glycosyltransferase involved in cell wall biosynthesis